MMSKSGQPLGPTGVPSRDAGAEGAAPLTTLRPIGPVPAALVDPFADTAPAASAPRSPMGARLSWAGLLRFKRSIALTGALVAGVSVPAIWALVVPQFRAKATVEVLLSRPHVLYRTDDDKIPYHDQYFASQPSQIMSVGLLKRVLAKPEVQKTNWYQEPHTTLLGRALSRVEALRSALLAEPRPCTFLIDVSMRTKDGRDAEVIVNAVVDEYLELARERSREADETVYQRLVQSKQTLAAEIERRKAVTDELRRALGAATSADVVPRGKAWLEDRQAKLEEVRRDIETAQWQEQELQKLLAPVAGQAAPATPPYADDPEWRRLHIELRTVQHDIDANPQQLGAAHPERVALTEKAKLLEDLLHEQEQHLDKQWRLYGGKPPVAGDPGAPGLSPAAELAAMQRRIGMLKKQEELLQGDVDRRETSYENNFDLAKVLDRENEALRYDMEKYDLVRRRIDEKDTEDGVFISTRLVAAAFAPNEPDHDRRPLLTFAVLVAALGCGLGVGYVRLCVSPEVHEEADLAPTSQAPFLGKLLLLRHRGRADPLEVAVQGECIRMLRTALLERLNGGARGGTVLITSAGAGAGKTSVACMLARSLAQLDKKVLLVEADWRSPAVCRTLDLKSGPGLIDALRAAGQRPVPARNTATDDDGLLVSASPRLSVLPAGHVRSVADTELLAGVDFPTCLERWRRVFDVVLLDGPPVLPVADARIIARQVTGTVMVVREEHCHRTDVVDALAALGVSGAKMLGTVFIGSIRSASQRRGYYDYALPDAGNECGLDARSLAS